MKKSRNSGFSMVEMLAAVGIIVILLSISIVPVVHYIDDLEIAELDNAAREIFMAAENRAVLLSNAQQLNSLVTDNGKSTKLKEEYGHTGRSNKPETASVMPLTDPETTKKENLFFVYSTAGSKIYKELLDDKNIDPTLLEGDFFIVYDLESGSVTDVFYAKKAGALSTLVSGNSTELDEGEKFADFYDIWADSRSARLGLKNSSDNVRNPDNTLVGWYNGDTVASGKFTPGGSENPYIDVEIENGEKLTVKLAVKGEYVTYIKSDFSNLKVWLGPTGVELNGDNSVELKFPAGVTVDTSKNFFDYTWVVDSLTPGAGETKFADLVSIKGEDGKIIGYKVNPGDDFTVVATITHEEKSFSDRDTDNSLFWKDDDCDSSGQTAYIKYLRHLQNLDAEGNYVSGVKSASTLKTKAVQVDNILGDNNKTYPRDPSGSEPYQFVPIVNSMLKSYTVQEENADAGDFYAIYNLTLNVADSTASVGLFSETRKAGMTLSGIRMVNTKVSAAGAASVGALAGTAYDNVNISNCWVYWEEGRLQKGKLAGNSDGVLSKNKELQYQLKGQTVGGLVGVVKKYEEEVSAAANLPTFDHCLAATLIQGTINAGGLVGQVSAGAEVTVSHSYADCYLNDGSTYTTAKVAGLVGNLEVNNGKKAQVTLTDCYAAGFITRGETIAGLCRGGGITIATNVYSVMLKATVSGGKYVYEAPKSLTGNETDNFEDKNVYFLGEGTYGKPFDEMNSEDFRGSLRTKDEEGNETNSFEWKKPKSGVGAALDPDPVPGPGPESGISVMPAAASTVAKGSYPYKLLEDLKDYDYPGLKGLPHYGDWGELELDKFVALVYYEQYGKGDWGIVGFDINGKKIDHNMATNVDEKISSDGYAIAVKKENLIGIQKIQVTYWYGTNKLEKADVPFASTQEIKNVQIEGNTEPVDVYLIFLPSDQMEKCGYAPSDFYWNLNVELYREENPAEDAVPYARGEYFFNPHFAKTVNYAKEWSKNGTTEAEHAQILDKTIIVRTPRHLYDLCKYDNYCHNTALKYTFKQELNLDLSPSSAYYETYISPRGPIGTKGADSTDTTSFNGTYDGSSLFIKGLNMTVSGDNQGLFGYNTGEIKNLTVKGTVSASDSGSNVGGIVGCNGGVVTNCHFSGFVSTSSKCVGGVAGQNAAGGTVAGCGASGTIKGSQSVGGIVGENYGELNGTVETATARAAAEKKKFANDATVTSTGMYAGGIVGYNQAGGTVTMYENKSSTVSGGSYVGGIMGSNDGTLSECTNSNAVSGGSYIGGIVGSNSGTLANCTNSNTISGSSYVGGIAGYNSGKVGFTEEGSAAECTNNGKVTGVSSVGGIVGSNSGTVGNCTNSKAVTGVSSVGGIVGQNSGDVGFITTGIKSEKAGCTNSGAVEGTSDDSYAGGIVGKNVSGTVANCANNNNVKGKRYVGGIAGWNENGTVDNCSNSATIRAAISDGDAYVGGIVGYSYKNGVDTEAEVKNCWNTGGVIAQIEGLLGARYGYNAGGIVGYNKGGKVIMCTNSAKGEFDKENGLYILGSGGIDGHLCVGGLVGYNDNGTVEGSESSDNTGTVYCKSGDGGGIVGYNTGADAEVKNCENKGVVTSYKCDTNGKVVKDDKGNAIYDGKRVGGIVGQNVSGTVTNCGNSGSIDGNQTIAGIVGYNELGAVEECHNSSGAITASEDFPGSPVSLAGIVGSNSGGTVAKCYNTGSLTYEGESKGVGGIVGSSVSYSLSGSKDDDKKDDGGKKDDTDKKSGDTQLGGQDNERVSGTILYCYNTGDIFSNGDNIGGIVGDASDIKVISCYNTGMVIPYSDTDGNGQPLEDLKHEHGDYIGGIVGQGSFDVAILNCYNSYGIKDRDFYGDILGGVDNSSTTNIEDCYYIGTQAISGNINNGKISGATRVTTCQIESGTVAMALQYWVYENWESVYKSLVEEDSNGEDESAVTHPVWGQWKTVECKCGSDYEDKCAGGCDYVSTEGKEEKPYPVLLEVGEGVGADKVNGKPMEGGGSEGPGTLPDATPDYSAVNRWTVDASKLIEYYGYRNTDADWMNLWIRDHLYKVTGCDPSFGADLSGFYISANYGNNTLSIGCYYYDEITVGFTLTVEVPNKEGNGTLTIKIYCPAYNQVRSLDTPDMAAVGQADAMLPPELTDPDVPDLEDAALLPEPALEPAMSPGDPEDSDDEDTDGEDPEAENPDPTPVKVRRDVTANRVTLRHHL